MQILMNVVFHLGIQILPNFQFLGIQDEKGYQSNAHSRRNPFEFKV